MKDIIEFKMDGNRENIMNRYGKIMIQVTKAYFTQNLVYASVLQFFDRIDTIVIINSDDKHRIRHEIEMKNGND